MKNVKFQNYFHSLALTGPSIVKVGKSLIKTSLVEGKLVLEEYAAKENKSFLKKKH
jgi:hypothetical protein